MIGGLVPSLVGDLEHLDYFSISIGRVETTNQDPFRSIIMNQHVPSLIIISHHESTIIKHNHHLFYLFWHLVVHECPRSVSSTWASGCWSTQGTSPRRSRRPSGDPTGFGRCGEIYLGKPKENRRKMMVFHGILNSDFMGIIYVYLYGDDQWWLLYLLGKFDHDLTNQPKPIDDGPWLEFGE